MTNPRDKKYDLKLLQKTIVLDSLNNDGKCILLNT